MMERPQGYEVKAHQHPPQDRYLTTTSECLFIEKGKVKITVFDEEWKELAIETMQTGDFLIFFRGGHALTMLEPTRMIEVKQGPYAGDKESKSYK
jgi:oxalate decarboxylase/phosphoglucose isomerase-like protein (cupin superfamily)